MSRPILNIPTQLAGRNVFQVPPIVDSAQQRVLRDIQSQITPPACVIALCVGFTPVGTGPDVGEVVLPYDPADGVSVLTWNVRRITLRVGTAGGAPAVTIEKSVGTGAFSATTLGTITLASGAHEGALSANLGTVLSGQKIRFNVGTLGTATAWNLFVELEAQS